MLIYIQSIKVYAYTHCTILFLTKSTGCASWRSMDIPSLWLVTSLTMYSTLSTCNVIFSIGNGVELVKLGLLAKFYVQLVSLVG